MKAKILLAITIGLISLSISGYSSMDGQSSSDMETLKQRIDAIECANTRCCFPICAKRVGCGFFVTGEVLYWKAAEKGLTYAIKGKHNSQTDPIAQTILPKGKSHHPDFDYHLGFRVGAGWVMPHDCWDIYAVYTRYHTHSHDSVSIGAQNPDIIANANSIIPSVVTTPGDYIYPFWIAKLFINNIPATVNSAKAHWQLHIDLIDGELGKVFFVSRYLSLRPHVGVRAARIDQKYHLDFIRLQDPFGPSNIAHEWDLHMRNEFRGLGLRGGLDTNWCLGCGFSIFGDIAFSLVAGDFHTSFKQEADGFDVDGNQTSSDFFRDTNRLDANTAIIDMELGFEWSHTFVCKCRQYKLAIWAGYEQHIFFEQNQFMNYQYDFTLELPAPLVSQGPNYFIDGGNLNTTGYVGGLKFSF